jgi:hypothetical protein
MNVIMLSSIANLRCPVAVAKMLSVEEPPSATTSSLTTLRRSNNALVNNINIRCFSFPAPKLFDYETIVKNLKVTDAIESVEQVFGAVSKGQVDVPMPMHIGIEESSEAGPGD